MIAYFESIYGTMSVNNGKKHTYLGMDINLINIGQAKIRMIRYIDESVEEFTEDVSTPVSSPHLTIYLKPEKENSYQRIRRSYYIAWWQNCCS